MIISMPKILCLYDKNGCCFWRSWQPLQEVKKSGLADVHFIELRVTSKKDLAKELAWCDIVHMLGIMELEGLLTMREWQNLGRKVVVDYDDLHFNVSPFNTAYRKFGLEDVQVKNPATGDIQFLWKDGVNGFDIKANRLKFNSYQQILKEVDLVTTTTLYLKNAMKEVQPEANIKVLPNAINFKVWTPLEVRGKHKEGFRFGWAVSGSHGEDWLFIKPALVEFLKRHPETTFVCVGDTYMDITKGLPEGQVEWYPFSDLWEMHYPLRMALLGLDCAIAPLADLEFNRCKSPLKFEEYTAFGWPVIAQKMPPYSDCIAQGENGLLAETTEDWVRCLELLYSNKDLRAKLHFNALHTVKDWFDLRTIAKEYADVYKGVLEI